MPPALLRPILRRTPRRTAAVALLAAALLAGGSAPAVAAPDLGQVRLRLVQVATPELPMALARRPGDARLFLAERGGAIRTLRGGVLEAYFTVAGIGLVGEGGLLGLAFAPDGRWLYASHTNGDGSALVLTEYAVGSTGAVLPGTRRTVLRMPHPTYTNHYGGAIAFGPDGHLYLATGDGGGAFDPDGNAQDRAVLLGKVLRISPRPAGGRAYGIPAGNPFLGRPGRDEIWMLGLRNPWRFSFDRATGELWIGDVGQDTTEEINRFPKGGGAGANLGWPYVEGTRVLRTPVPAGVHAPVHTYSHAAGDRSVTGGYVYRGSAVAHLPGAYVFGDYVSGRVGALVLTQGRVSSWRWLGVRVPALVSFGEDAAGELFALSFDGGGRLYRLRQA